MARLERATLCISEEVSDLRRSEKPNYKCFSHKTVTLSNDLKSVITENWGQFYFPGSVTFLGMAAFVLSEFGFDILSVNVELGIGLLAFVVAVVTFLHL